MNAPHYYVYTFIACCFNYLTVASEGFVAQGKGTLVWS